MSVEGKNFTWTIQAGESLDNNTPGTGSLFKAVTLSNGLIADNGLEAGGILIYGGRLGENVTLAYQGALKFAAGASVQKGNLLTVTSSGYFIPASPDDHVVGRCLDADVSSGAIGTGIFNFSNPAKRG